MPHLQLLLLSAGIRRAVLFKIRFEKNYKTKTWTENNSIPRISSKTKITSSMKNTNAVFAFDIAYHMLYTLQFVHYSLSLQFQTNVRILLLSVGNRRFQLINSTFLEFNYYFIQIFNQFSSKFYLHWFVPEGSITISRKSTRLFLFNIQWIMPIKIYMKIISKNLPLEDQSSIHGNSIL